MLGKNFLSGHRRERTSGEKAFELASPRHQRTELGGSSCRDAFAASRGVEAGSTLVLGRCQAKFRLMVVGDMAS